MSAFDPKTDIDDEHLYFCSISWETSIDFRQKPP